MGFVPPPPLASFLGFKSRTFTLVSFLSFFCAIVFCFLVLVCFLRVSVIRSAMVPGANDFGQGAPFLSMLI